MKKRLLALVLALVMIFSLVPVTSSAANFAVTLWFHNTTGYAKFEKNPSSTPAYYSVVDGSVVAWEGETPPEKNYIKVLYTNTDYPHVELTLNEIDIESNRTDKNTGNAAIYFTWNSGKDYAITINLIGENKISSGMNAGLRVAGKLGTTITGSGSLIMEGTNPDGVILQDNGGDLTFKDTTVNLNNKHGGWWHGIYANGAGCDVIIDGSDVTSFGSIFFGTSRSNTDTKNPHNISIINGSNVNISHSGQSNLYALHAASGSILIKDSNVSAYTTINGGRAMRLSPDVQGTCAIQYSTNKTGSFTSPKNFDIPAGTSLHNDAYADYRYIRVTHTCITEDNDGDCTTATICGCGKQVIAASGGHVAGEPTNDCTEGVKCVNCDSYTTAPKDHNLRAPVIENETDAGYDNVYICDDCGMEVLREYISKLCPHTNSTLLNQDDATCTENGLAVYHCSDCNEDYEVVLEAPGHDHQVATIVGATIFEKGYTVYTCTVCGNTYHSDYTDKILPIAVIGTDPYFSLKEAVDAAKPGDEIILWRSQKTGEAVYIEKDLTIDFNGCYYSMDQAYSGAAMYIARGATVTLKNSKPDKEGKLAIAYSSNGTVCATSFVNLIQNYGTLYVQDVVLNGSNTFGEPTTATIFNAGVVELGAGTVVKARTTALHNEGTLTKAADVEVAAPSGFHFEEDTGKLVSHSYTVTQHGATVYEFAHNLYTCKCGEFFKEYTGTEKLRIYAKIPATGMSYASLQEAVDAAENGQLIEMTQGRKECTSLIIPSGKKITIDMKGYYYAIGQVTGDAGMIIEEGAELNLISTDITGRFVISFSANYTNDNIQAVIRNYGTLTAENVQINGNNLYGNGKFAIFNYNSLTLKDNAYVTVFPDTNVGEIAGNYTEDKTTNAPLADAEQMENVDIQKDVSAGGPVTLHPGSEITYTITLTNNNGYPVSLNVTDLLPNRTEFVSGCDDVREQYAYWSVKNLQPFESHTITYKVKNTNTLAQVKSAKSDIKIKNTSLKVVGKSVPTEFEYIWVLETFNKEDRRKIEMGIDSMVTANLTAKNSSKQQMNRIPLLTMMYYVGFSAGPGLGYTDPADVLTAIYEKAGQGGGGSTGGGVEDVVDTASNLLHKVVPTLYGGTAVSADKDELFRGARATEVKVTDLISGDAIFVQNNGKTQLYVYDGTYLVELAETKVTTNIMPETVLDTLTDSERFAVIRVSIGYNITFALKEGEYFNAADKEGWTDLEKQLIATAESYLLRGDRNQYTDDMTGTGQFRWQSSLKLPEDCTVDYYGYSNCAAFTHDVHWATYGQSLKAKNTSGTSVSLNTTTNLASSAARGWNPETLTGSNASTVFYCTPMVKNADGKYVSTMTAEEQAATKELIISLLRPGDIICIRRTTNSGHAMLYAGNGTIIHSSGSSYSDTNKTDTHEATIRFRMVEDLFDPTVYASSSYVFNLESFSIVRPQNLYNLPATENTMNRYENMQGVIAEKLTSVGTGETVNCGDLVTYTFQIFNTNKTEKAFAIRDVLDENVTFVSATNGGAVDGSNVSWDIVVPAETRVSVSYTVKVKDGLANYTEINNTKATINGVMHRCYNTYVANTLTADQQQALLNAVETVKGMDISNLNSVEIAELIYKTAFGVEDLFGEKVTNYSMLLDGGNNQQNSSAIVKGEDNVGIFNDAWYWESSNKSTVALMNYNTSNPAMMVAPGMWGGQLVMNSTYTSNGRDERFTRYLDVDGKTVLRNRYFGEEDLVIGDFFLMRGKTAEQMYLYVGNDTFLSIGASFDVFSEKSVAERFEYAPADEWKKLAVLRPSIVLDI